MDGEGVLLDDDELEHGVAEFEPDIDEPRPLLLLLLPLPVTKPTGILCVALFLTAANVDAVVVKGCVCWL